MNIKKIAMIAGAAFVAFIALGAILSALGVEPSEPDEATELAEEAEEPDEPDEQAEELDEPDEVEEPEQPEDAEPEQPEITDDHTELMRASIEEESAVQDSAVSIDDDQVSIALVVDAATDEDEARRLLDNAARLLATFVAGDSDDLNGPDADSLGDLWDHYTLDVSAGPTPDNLIAQGAKVPTSPHITW